MEQSNIFAGMNGFIWWIGVVENRKDPLNVGRCQIRVFGWHTDDKTLIPTKDLPWAQPVLPVNNAKSFNTPVEGDWVIGFFFDGAAGQVPVYFGVLPGIPTPYVNNPQKGFSDPRSSAELASAPNLPKTNEILTDGGGSTVTNQPAQRYPVTAGYPNTNLLAINDLKNPPPSIAQRYLDATSGIPGPDAKSLNTEIAGAAQGAAAAIQGITADPKALVPTASSLSSSLKMSGGSVSSLLGGASNLASQLVGNNPTAQAEIEKAKLQLAQSNVDKQLADATAKATEAQNKATASLNTSLDSLKSGAGNIANALSSKLSGLSPGNISTKTPVIVDVGSAASLNASASSFEMSLYKNTPDDKLIYTGTDSIIWNRTNRERLRRGLPSLTDIGYPPPPEPAGASSTTPKANLGAVAPGNLVSTYAPNTIPSEVPLDKSGSTYNKSTENTVTLYKETVTTAYGNILNNLNSLTSRTALNSYVAQAQPAWIALIGKTGTVASAAGDSNIQKELDAFIAPLRASLNSAKDAAYTKTTIMVSP